MTANCVLKAVKREWRGWMLAMTLLLGISGQAFAGDGCCAAAGSAAATLRDKWGIEIAALRLSAQGYFVDFRYKVVDPEKAAPLAAKENKPYLIDAASGKRLGVPTTPKLGSIRQTTQKLTAGQVYFMFFGNSRGLVKSGSKVTVVVGDIRLENLTIE